MIYWEKTQMRNMYNVFNCQMYTTVLYSGLRVARSLVFCVVFCRSLFVLFLVAIVLSVLLTAPDYIFCLRTFLVNVNDFDIRVFR